MKKEWKYFFLLGGAALIYLCVEIFGPREHDWTITFNNEDKNPFGGYALGKLVQDIFPGKSIRHSYKTLYELYDSARRPVNLLSISSDFSPEKEDIKSLLKNVQAGGNAFLAAQYFSYSFYDTLKFYIQYDYQALTGKEDSIFIRFKDPYLPDKQQYSLLKGNTASYFSRFDTTNTSVIAVNDSDQPVLVHIKLGKGNLYLSSIPLIYTNAFLLHKNNPSFVATTLSLLPSNDVLWTEYYHAGRMEARTPLRFVLTTEPLAWAYYLTIFAIILFMIMEAKRKQRIIPIIKPLTNTSLEFITTIGNLYLQNSDHKNIANKKINFLLEHIRTKYWLNTHTVTPHFISILAKRSGNTEDDIKNLFKFIDTIQVKYAITPNELMELNNKIEKFHNALK